MYLVENGWRLLYPNATIRVGKGKTVQFSGRSAEEEVALSDYADYADAREQIGRFLEDVYTHKRIHSALGYLTPAEFEQDWYARHVDRIPRIEPEKTVQF